VPNPSLHHLSTTRWPRHRTATTSFGHFWRQTRPSVSRNTSFPAPQYPSTATHTSTGKPRPYVPAFQSVHDLSHPGTKSSAKLLAQRFVWPGVQKDCRTWARDCQACTLQGLPPHSYFSGRLH
jgi:hypothetical protein